jgi:thiamine biosynthesis protein ThiS
LQVYINGKVTDIPDALALSELEILLELPATRIAVEVNRVVVRRVDWEKTLLTNEDRVEIVHFVGGG